MTARVTISLPDELLSQVDAIATDESLTRSDVVREAAGAYVAAHADAAEAKQRLRAVEGGITWLKGIALQPSLDSRSTLKILREVRGDPADATADTAGPSVDAWERDTGEGR